MKTAVLRHPGLRIAALLFTLLLTFFPLSGPGPEWRTVSEAHAQTPRLPCPDRPTSFPGMNFAGKDLTRVNFRGQNLTNADFSGALLAGTMFIGANLTGANFSSARFQPVNADDQVPTDFTSATLTSACFNGATFTGNTYFTHADITCADFSQTDISTGHAIFGEDRLKFDPARCRPAFRATTLSCEFIADWAALNLSSPPTYPSTDARACATELAGFNFSNGQMAALNFSGANLDGTSFANADLTQAVFIGASLQCSNAGTASQKCANLSNTKLHGANFNGANLTGANLSNAFLSTAQNNPAASVRNAHLKNANLSSAQLTGVDFSFSNFYSGQAGVCKINADGSTANCASARGATMTETRFTDAYLYGTDFSNTEINAGEFSRAVLIGATFAGARISTGVNGLRTTFDQAHLQGTVFPPTLAEASLADAVMDFRSGGNLIYISLPGASHNQFACALPGGCTPPPGKDVCVVVNYEYSAPPTGSTIICPDGNVGGPGGCGPATGANARWNRKPSGASLPVWYAKDASYTKAPVDIKTVCNGGGQPAAVPFW